MTAKPNVLATTKIAMKPAKPAITPRSESVSSSPGPCASAETVSTTTPAMSATPSATATNEPA